ncbi:MAG: FeoB-associated Cys-rich membrane protein [Oscillospiraceae bacterium]
MGTWIILGILAVAVVLALISVRKSVKGGGCPGGCSGCSGSCQCHSDDGKSAAQKASSL